MGTANFCYKDKLFVVETDGDEADRDCIIENLHEDMYELLDQLNTKADSKNKKITIEVTNETRPTWSRIDKNHTSFCAMHHGNIVIRSNFLGLPIKMDLEVLVRSGYYDHVNIDHNVSLFVDGIDFHEDSDAYDIMAHFETCVINEGMRVLQRDNFDKRLDAMRELAGEIFNHIGRTLGTEYHKGSTASNGESGYHKTDKPDSAFNHMKLAA